MTDVPPGNEPPPYPGQQPIPEPQPYQGQGQQYPPSAPQPAYNGGGGFKPKHPQATTVLVLGIVGFLLCQILGPVAWIMGNKGIKEIDANPGQYDGRTELLVGKILGIVSTVLLVLSILALILFFAFFFTVAASDPDFFNEIDSETYSSLLSVARANF